MTIRPYAPSRYELPIYLGLLALCVSVALMYAGCRVDSAPRVTTWSRAHPPVVLQGPAKPDEDGGHDDR